MAWKFDSPSCFWKQFTCPPSQSQVYIPELYESVAQAGVITMGQWGQHENTVLKCVHFFLKITTKCSNPNHVETENSSELVNDFSFFGGGYYCILDYIRSIEMTISVMWLCLPMNGPHLSCSRPARFALRWFMILSSLVTGWGLPGCHISSENGSSIGPTA